ncbi:hypothetical protein BTO07_10390 [Polaribacter sp. SA4-12]|nr:hypothetical protein BTO07_10390 [Polaribacter sp. SA4-12]
MKANINSIFIIFCSLFAIYEFVKNKRKVVLKPNILILTSVFWMFLLHEVITLDFNSKTILLHLPFLIFPLLFVFKPNYINDKVKEYSLLVFQGSVVIQSLIYLFVFLKKYNLVQIFSINNYNIPLFRTYVFENTSIEIHPTYFSAFLLFSFTISLFLGVKKQTNKYFTFQIINILFTTFFIFVFISKIIIIAFVFTIFVFIIRMFLNFKRKKIIQILIPLSIIGALFYFGSSRLIKERFNEIRTEINRPLVGDYHNSINIRVAIIKCSFKILKELPFWGYGQDLQNKLNDCYEINNDSNFYTLATYNSHNYYLNLILYGGWLFLLLFIFFLVHLIWKENYSILIITFILQVLIINFTENFFSRQHGIVLFIYFISLFLTPNRKFRNCN